MGEEISIILIEDNESYRNVIKRALNRASVMKLLCQFGTAEIALRTLRDDPPSPTVDVVLLDLNLPGMSGLEALPYFRQSLPDAKVIILTQSDKEADVLGSIALGASGYLLKSASNKEIKEAIHTVMGGGASLDPKVAQFILKTLEHKPLKKEETSFLTDKELQVLTLISEGLEQKEIAAELSVSRNTVAFHIKHIYEKLDVQNAPSAVAQAFKKGIFNLD
ncbi:response regulator [Rubritalea spongiae]|uniref:Response regulator n=1 Tax=Rubritalea spongiae TaxID=430797 RepID=A0ABW5E2P5_9BACT